MSQIQSFLQSAGPGPGPVMGLAVDDATVIAPSVGIINIVGKRPAHAFPSSVGFIETDPGIGGNDLFIGPLTATVTSNDTTFATLFSFTMSNDTGIILIARIVGLKDDISVVAGGNLSGFARKPGAGAVTVPKVVGSLGTDKAVAPFPQARIVNVGNTLQVQVAGASLGDVYNWTAHIEYQVQ